MRQSLLWGCHVDEYQRMFALQDMEPNAHLLEYTDAPTAVNAEWQMLNQFIVSCGPLYILPLAAMSKALHDRFDLMTREIKMAHERYDFSYYGSVDAWLEKRHKGLLQFLADYELGLKSNRYIPDTQTNLPFNDFEFDIALCAYGLFSGTAEQDVAFHLNCLQELARVAKEVRIFPLIDEHGHPSDLIGPVLLGLQEANYGVEIREVEDTLQRRGHAMLRVWALECAV